MSFACAACGEPFDRYLPSCPTCKRGVVGRVQAAASSAVELPRRRAEYLKTDVRPYVRMPTGLASVDLALGGGIVIQSSAVYLLGGSAGSGKSTMAFLWAEAVAGAAYFALLSEGARERWDEIGARTKLAQQVPFYFVERVEDVVEEVEATRPALVVVDQLNAFEQTGPGSEIEALLSLVRVAQSTKATVLILAEREKANGSIRGSGSLEHKADAVLLLEKAGDVGSMPPTPGARRWLRVKKNRLGTSDVHPELALTERGWAELPKADCPAVH